LLQPQIREEAAAYARRPIPRPIDEVREFATTFALDRDAAGRPRVAVFVELTGADALDRLRAAGAEIGSVVGDMAVVRYPLDALEDLRAMPLGRIEAARALTFTHDSSMSAIRVDAVRQRTSAGWTGT